MFYILVVTKLDLTSPTDWGPRNSSVWSQMWNSWIQLWLKFFHTNNLIRIFAQREIQSFHIKMKILDAHVDLTRDNRFHCWWNRLDGYLYTDGVLSRPIRYVIQPCDCSSVMTSWFCVVSAGIKPSTSLANLSAPWSISKRTMSTWSQEAATTWEINAQWNPIFHWTTEAPF